MRVSIAFICGFKGWLKSGGFKLTRQSTAFICGFKAPGLGRRGEAAPQRSSKIHDNFPGSLIQFKLMPVLLGPLFSMSASGLFSKALLFYDTKYGARVRLPKKRFVPPNNVWEVNKEWFKKASDRVKTLTAIQKQAWKYEYLDICDVWRDIFMGQQIELWNLSPLNDLSWPNIDCPVYTFSPGFVYYYDQSDSYSVGFRTKDYLVIEAKIAGFRWYNTDDFGNPVEEDFKKETVVAHTSFSADDNPKQYFYAKAYYFNGNLTGFQYIGQLP